MLSLQIDWPNVPAKEALFFGLLFGGGMVFIACLMLHWWRMGRLERLANHECDLAGEEGYRRGLNDRAARPNVLEFSDPRNDLARKAADRLSL